MKTQKIVIEIKSEIDNDAFIDQIAQILVDNKLICNMWCYSGINRAECINEVECEGYDKYLEQSIAGNKKQQQKIMSNLNKTIAKAINEK